MFLSFRIFFTIIAMFGLVSPLWAADDLAAARQLTVTQCSQCHTFDKDENHGQGPNLFGLIGREAAARATALKVDMPITQAVCDVIDGKTSARDALERLLSREPKPEANTGAASG